MSIAYKPSDFTRSASPDLSKKKVLVIEDFASFRHTLKHMLRSFDITHVDDVATGEEAVAKIATKRYDIILCDYNLGPGKDGQQLLEEIKYREFVNYSTIFMMITAENTMNMFLGAMEYQPDDYLMKPFTKGALEKKIRDLIKKKENVEEIDKAIEKKEFARVIELCDQLIANKVNNLSEVLKLKGEFLIKTENYAEAESFYKKVLTMGNLPWALLGLGRIKFMTGHLHEALEVFEDIISKNKNLMAAYDWLAKTQEKLGNLQEAQQILMEAVQISPRAILRQKALGNLAFANKDLTVAEQALKEAVKQGKHSCFKDPADHVTLAETLVESDQPAEGIAILNEAQKEFADVPDAVLPIAIAESLAYSKMNRREEAKSAARRAAAVLADPDVRIPRESGLNLAKAFLLAGDSEKGREIVRHLVQSNHEDQDFLGGVQDMFTELRMEEKGREIVTAARSEVTRLNNQGVQLVRDGSLEKAIAYFKKAAQTLPENKVINANTAQAIMLHMKKNGTNDSCLKDAMEYINRVKSIDSSYKGISKLLNMYKELAGKE